MAYQSGHGGDARADQPRRRLALWVSGAVLAVAFALAPSALPLSAGALALFLVLMLWSRTAGDRPAVAGGAATTLGGLFLHFTQRSIEQCAAYNTGPNSHCEMGDSTPAVMIASTFLLLGLALTAWAFRRLPPTA